jgi:hypothetical protein
MAKTKSTLEFYGYDYDSTMVKKDDNSKVVEQQNRKYIKMDTINNEENNDENNG